MATTPVNQRPAPKFKAGDAVLTRLGDTIINDTVQSVYWQEAALYCNPARWMVCAGRVTAPESDFVGA